MANQRKDYDLERVREQGRYVCRSSLTMKFLLLDAGLKYPDMFFIWYRCSNP